MSALLEELFLKKLLKQLLTKLHGVGYFVFLNTGAFTDQSWKCPGVADAEQAAPALLGGVKSSMSMKQETTVSAERSSAD